MASFDLFNTAETFGRQFYNQRRYITVASPGSVAIEVLHKEGTWVNMSTITTAGVYQVEFPNADVRITPSGGAEVSLK